MVLNVRELMHIFRRVWQDFGPFPLIGCDSECLAWHITGDNNLKAPKGHEVSAVHHREKCMILVRWG